jgi:hypothetical protein
MAIKSRMQMGIFEHGCESFVGYGSVALFSA